MGNKPNVPQVEVAAIANAKDDYEMIANPLASEFSCYSYEDALQERDVDTLKRICAACPSFVSRENFKLFREACLRGDLTIAIMLYSNYTIFHNPANARYGVCHLFPFVCENGHMHVVKWLYSLEPRFLSSKGGNFMDFCYGLKFALQKKHYDLAEWLIETNPTAINHVNLPKSHFICMEMHCSKRNRDELLVQMKDEINNLKQHSTTASTTNNIHLDAAESPLALTLPSTLPPLTLPSTLPPFVKTEPFTLTLEEHAQFVKRMKADLEKKIRHVKKRTTTSNDTTSSTSTSTSTSTVVVTRYGRQVKKPKTYHP